MGITNLTLHPKFKPRTSQEQAARLAWSGWWIIFGALFPIGLWMTIAPLSMAVIAPGFVKVDLNRRPVQHLEGGIVRQVLVRDGQTVKAGQPILILGDVGVDADRNRLAYRVDVERAAIARYEAEQMLSPVLVFPADLLESARHDDRIRLALQKETSLFETRRVALDSEVALMNKLRTRIDEEIVALNAQIAHAENSHDAQLRALDSNRALVKEGYIGRTQIMQLEAGLADYAVKLEERRAEMALAQQRLVDLELKIGTVRNAYVEEASDHLKVTSSQLSEIEQERRKSDDAARRQVVVAPADGEVMELKFTSPGAIVRSGEPIAEIVPDDAQLMIEAQIRPEDINNIYLNQSARIKFTAFKYRNTVMVTGKVTYISADRLVDKATNVPYYSAMILADAESLRSADDLELMAGMPAEVYIEGSTQTPLQYLTAPITDTVRKAGRQI